MVLVDTSVWIRFLANKQPYAGGLERLLDRDEVSGHEFVFGELLIGDKAGRAKLLEAYAQIHRATIVSHEEVVAFVRERRLHGRGVGWIDVHLLASAVVESLQFWTADKSCASLAEELGVSYV
jgi:predicted nucleic acid-binding protein